MQTFDFTFSAGLDMPVEELQNPIMKKENYEEKQEIFQNEYQPTEETLEAMRELEEGRGVIYESFEDFKRDLLR
ncbi:MAG: hypothetical protein IJZ06_06905 [Bacteroidales bacterium]|nr:hypothetical protein [Bacteroidales bacterium]